MGDGEWGKEGVVRRIQVGKFGKREGQKRGTEKF